MGQTMSLGLCTMASTSRSSGGFEDSASLEMGSTGMGTLRKGNMASSSSTLQRHPMRRSASDSVLHGVSSNASSENARARNDLQRLGIGRQAKRQVRSTNVKNTAGDGADQDGAIKDFDRLTTAIGEVKTAFDAFDPRRTKKVPFSVIFAGGKGAQNDVAAGGDEDEDAVREKQERLAERLQAYKFARRFESELPPLARAPPGTLQPKKPPPQQIVARNTSVEAIGVWLPPRRLAHIQSFAEEKTRRTEVYQTERDRMVEESSVAWMQDLERKWRQGRQAVESRKKQAKLQGISQEFPVAKWISLMWAVGWLEQLRQDLALKKLPSSERLEYIKSNEDKLLIKRSAVSNKQQGEAIKFEEVSASPTVARIVTCTVANVKLKKRIRQARASAQLACNALRAWQVAGRVIFSLKNVVHKARIIQRFWRQCSVQLRAVRESIAARWEKLERQELAIELSKFAQASSGGKFKASESSGLSLEERINIELVTKNARQTFLEHELRARRYFVLPQIAQWKSECVKWQNDFNAYLETKRAYETLGKEYDVKPEHSFSWPPARPMHAPPNHPIGETARGAICSFGCPGRRGDEEILDMWRRCRADPTSWKRLPRTGEKLFEKKKKKKDTPEEPTNPAPARRKSLTSLLDDDKDIDFGEAPQKDMVKHGVDESTLPGGEPPAEVEPQVAAPC
eukprot:TRINITY_DN983_c0_g1_i1.p1 TRINITY_DN983_c0_g1~~TRINITY_DN983_c0_g1_i1.p1  ORF type:complete len:752 (+),score=162.55 TRINITY_DN983_c0_g1_i1:208-2256(+)